MPAPPLGADPPPPVDPPVDADPLVDAVPAADPYPFVFGPTGTLQNVAVISSMQITPVLGSDDVFVWPPAPSGCCTDCAATGDAARSSAAINVNFFIEWLPSLE